MVLFHPAPSQHPSTPLKLNSLNCLRFGPPSLYMLFDLHIADILSVCLSVRPSLQSIPPSPLLHISHCKSNERRFFYVFVTVMELILAMRFVSDTVLIMVHFMSCFLKFLDFGRNPPTHSPFYFLWLFVTCCFPPSSPSVSSLQTLSVTARIAACQLHKYR